MFTPRGVLCGGGTISEFKIHPQARKILFLDEKEEWIRTEALCVGARGYCQWRKH